MISDPMTVPRGPSTRLVYAIVVAYVRTYALYKPNALVWALFLWTPLVPVIERCRPGQAFAWRAPNSGGGR